MPDICITALNLHAERQAEGHVPIGNAWPETGLVLEVYSEVPPAKTRSALKRLGRQLDG